ncbi:MULTISPECIES: DinB family protein [unclassified Aureispira]|uniref:DinB family protein n=1 Tax=unclassified Aureispira TaxID=2649989 RepID=UPI000698835D|nr:MULTISPECIES: DinB family protein [unclassified Aureispira]WMX12223.1 DinB family protein [Aureispira sp. CCB-E]
MPKTVQTITLLRELERLNQRLSEIVARDFANLSSEQLNWREHEEKWSIAECLLHLNYVADYYFPATLKAIKNSKSKKSKPQAKFTRGWLGHYYASKFRLNLDNQMKSKIESPSKYNPRSISSSQLEGKAIVQEFLANQDTLYSMLQDARLINLQKTRVYAAFLGLVSIQLGDMLKILVYHTERHIVQAQRILYHDYFPGNLPLKDLLSQRDE